MIQLLPVRPCHRHGCRLVQALVQQQGEQGWQDPGIVFVVRVPESGEHRGHVLGGLDVLAFNVVDPSRNLDVRRELIHQLRPQHRGEGVGMAEVGRETVEGVAQGPVAVEAREEGQIRLLLAEHIGAVADWIVVEGSGQTGQHHLFTAQLLAQTTGLQQILFHVIAVGTQNNEFAAADQVGQCVGDPLPREPMGSHVEHTLDMVRIHAPDHLFGEGTQQFATWPRCQQKPSGFVLHGAVVRQ